MSIVRLGPGDRSGRSSTWSGSSWPNKGPVERTRPPPRWRHWPVTAGRQAMARYAIAPCSRCSIPISSRIAAGRALAVGAGQAFDVGGGRDRRSRPPARAGTPWRARRARRTRRCGRGRTRGRRDRRAMITWSMPRASALSVPGRSCTCQSARGGGRRADRVDADDLGAVGLGLLDEGPEVAVGEQRVVAPEDDHLGVADVFRIDAQVGALRGAETEAGDGAAQAADDGGGAEAVEEPLRHRRHLDHALRAGVAEGQDGVAPVAVDRRSSGRRDALDRLVPRHLAELPAALRARCAPSGAAGGQGGTRGRGSG